MGCFYSETQQDAMHILAIYLLPEFQGCGVGTKILKQKQLEATDMGLPVCLTVLKKNHAKRLYERLGFVTKGENATHFIMQWN
jgi:ribosomal protein S18 acetylase RimI-like enzyme